MGRANDDDVEGGKRKEYAVHHEPNIDDSDDCHVHLVLKLQVGLHSVGALARSRKRRRSRRESEREGAGDGSHARADN
jgi:hypothetical protein